MKQTDGQNIMEKAFNQMLADGYSKDSRYDYLVLYSGGKDSTYLAHLMKQAVGGRVCLFSVDNGFETENAFRNMRKNANMLGCDLYIYHQPPERFLQYYNFLITETELRKLDSNPLCLYCNRYFMSLGVEFAERNNIPFVLHGATVEQLSNGLYAQSTQELNIFNTVASMFFEKSYKKISQMERYKQEETIKTIVDRLFRKPEKVKLIFPFQFLEYNIDKIKKTIEETYDWDNPVEGVSNDEYVTSGCELVKLFGVLEKYAGFGTHETQQFIKDYEKGIVSEKALKKSLKWQENILKATITPKVRELAKLLDLEDLLAAGDSPPEGASTTK